MKRKFSLLLLVVFVVAFSACGAAAPPAAPNPDTLPDAALEPPPYNATIEYGEPDLITDNSGPLFAYIRYPQAGDDTDGAIAEWADNLYQNAKEEIEERQKADDSAEGEINIQFDSYLVDDKYAGIVENGVFMGSHMAHPLDIVQTFNIDVGSGAMLENSDILDSRQNENILSLLYDKLLIMYPEADELLYGMYENYLSHIAISGDGIIVIIERGLALPTFFGELRVTLPYDELGEALRLGEETIPEAENGPGAGSEPGPVIPYIPPQSSEIDPSKPMAALTFDDGPSGHTGRILDLLEAYGCRATFCVIGNLAESRQETIKRASEMGCEVIGHSWDHRSLTKLSEQDIRTEILDTQNVLQSILGRAPTPMYRPPYGAYNDTVKKVSAELGYGILLWSVDPLDWKTRNAASVYSAIIGSIKDRSIVLSHDLYGTTADAMERVIPELVSQGYQLVTVSELLYYTGDTLDAGRIYTKGI